MKKSHKIIIRVFALFVIIPSVFYFSDKYVPSDEALHYLESTSQVTVNKIDEGYFLDGYGQDMALIFYPGAKVEYEAYSKLLFDVASNGIDVFLLKMPLNMAIFDTDKAQLIMDQYNYDKWIMCGHSMGGAMAASFASKNDNVDGLVLLAAYSIKEISDNVSVAIIYGSDDGVLNKDKLEKYSVKLPSDTQVVCIEGGNHAQFGDYGFQKGDNASTISYDKQCEETLDAILKLRDKINKKNKNLHMT